MARVVTLDDIAANDYNLNIPCYVTPKGKREVITVEMAMKRLEDSVQAAFATEEKVIDILKRESFLS